MKICNILFASVLLTAEFLHLTIAETDMEDVYWDADQGNDERVSIESDLSCDAAPPVISDYTKIYQDIWTADQDQNGVPGLLKTDPRDENRGYVLVDERPGNENPDHTLLSKVVIPDSKRATYDLVRELFDNYTLDQSKPETPQTSEEKAEVAAFINAIKNTAVMKVARAFMEGENGVAMTDIEWYDNIHKLWFEIYDFNKNTPHRSGFEHVFVGEQNRDRLGGYHFWYKYYLDDQALEGYANEKNNIDYFVPRYRDREIEGVMNTNEASFRFNWDAYDYENNVSQALFKSFGGFDIGWSPEGLIAIGMVCFNDPRSRKTTVIDNVQLELRLFKAGPENSHINTYYSMFRGFVMIPVESNTALESVSEATTPASKSFSNVRIIAALVNVDELDNGKENVSLVNTSNSIIDLKGWTIKGNNGNAYKLIDATLSAGEIRTFQLPTSAARLCSKTIEIILMDTDQKIVDVAKYNRTDIKSGHTVVF
mmetsp:Transcript_4604/g.5217  ORF Transcript_4604/g.5217 Transcript_4604/m.5217 type:complete len:483 (+) Transcript_4604:178-1626(+)